MLRTPRVICRLAGLLLLLVIVGCSTQQYYTVAFEAMYRADRSPLARYRQRFEGGYAKPVGLAIELSSDEPYVNGAYVSEGFCGEAGRVALLGGGELLKLPETVGTRFRHRYLAFIDIQSMLKPFAYPSSSLGTQITYDLESNPKAICIKTVDQGQIGPLLSNELRISPLEIKRALADDIKPLPVGLRTR